MNEFPLGSWSVLVDKADLGHVILYRESDVSWSDAQSLLRIERLALTSNIMTYAALGDELDYWGLFPAGTGQGRIPAWSHARVIEAHSDAVEVGTPLFGLHPGTATVTRVGPDSLVIATGGTHLAIAARLARTAQLAKSPAD